MAPRTALLSQNKHRRSARIQNLANTAESPVEAKSNKRITKPQPKPKTSQAKYDCSTCDRTLASSAFPDYLPTDTCEHRVNTCKTCLRRWIAVQIDSTTYDDFHCPECPELMQNSDIKLHAAHDVYKRFDQLERRGIAEKTPGWRWCLAPRCKAGQVHHPPNKNYTPSDGRKTRKGTRAISNQTPALNMCICNKCGAKACTDCDRPWHEDETCEDHAKRVQKKGFDKEEAASRKLIEKECKQCAGCQIKIQRNGGCDQMICSQCRTRFCFLCLRTYIEINEGGHAPACMYSRPGRIDPHAGNAPMFIAGAAGAAVMRIAGGAPMLMDGN